MCGRRVYAKADVCLMGRGAVRYSLLVQEDKRHMYGGDPVPQLIAEAIAAFYQNNRDRMDANIVPLLSAVILGITMTGTSPTFYKIPVSEELLTPVFSGQYPATTTIVERLVPSVPDLSTYRVQGVKPLENRRVVFHCFEAFRVLVHS
ncbi:hypothetical protein NEOLEDRAFT_1100122 [Neolentinus lepideus HHB14362 ss-1]|uniref:Uncharacterized protein n=1 Tax=Neolentinus lepideus HHB14362 ss-1 TaxID=1314782 RepID=A0A165PDQ7_9AGAM|nr:hypothetical protein NEOLEDRAFT_1100122 [Neolentinus lepideus HHB14362 ss-1]